MTNNGPRIEREKRTVRAMIQLYCRDKHAAVREKQAALSQPSPVLCPACQELEAYAMKRLEACRYGEQKPACTHCPTHCYKPKMREDVRQVMRYSGPRMLWHHPVLAILHLWDEKTKKVTKP